VTKPRFATYYRPDVVTLIAVGMCFGAAIALLAVTLRGTPER
jgi:dienelactone hydrolase